MSGEEPDGVVFPVSADGRRSTSALGQAAVSVARDGLASLHQRMRFVGRDGSEAGLDALVAAPAGCMLTAVTVTGTGVAESELSLPYRGERLRGSALLRRLEAWVTAGVIEPSCAAAIQAVAANPGWLALAALLVHDLNTSSGGPAQAHPWQDEARAAAHGGLWRIAYAPRSALGLAALLGYAAARNQPPGRGSLPDQRKPGIGVHRAARGAQHPGEIIGQIGGSAAQGAPRQQVVENRRGQRKPLGRGDGFPAQRQGQVQAVHHRLHDPAGRRTRPPAWARSIPARPAAAGTAWHSSMVLPNVSARTPGMSAGVLPCTMV